MKAKDVSVGIQETNEGLNVLVHFKIKSTPLEREAACPDPPKCDPNKYGTRVKEGARKRKEKELQKILESVEFPMGPLEGGYKLQVAEEIGDDDIISVEAAPEQIPVIWEDA